MDTLINCLCGHNFEQHQQEGCARCRCGRNRAAALESLIEHLRLDPMEPVTSPAASAVHARKSRRSRRG